MSSFLIPHSLIISLTAFDLSEVTLIITSSSFPSLNTSSLEYILSNNNSFFSLSVIIVNPPETAIIFQPAFLRALQRTFAPGIISRFSPMLKASSYEIPRSAFTRLHKPSSQSISPRIPCFVMSQISFSFCGPNFCASTGKYSAFSSTPSTSKIINISTIVRKCPLLRIY
uniref:Putative phosphoserine phosphatase n=1 Tax=uncultured crenarchaeote TaxID=29281 RepID=Q2V9E3_9CREN|nr:putative phosphoserine phosphatase [uncultured crenarchaeote]